MALDVIEELLVARHWNWVRLDGATKYETRQEVVRLFNTTSHQELPVFLLSTRAGGLGLNLQASADTVIIHDSDWNPQLDLQAMDRFSFFTLPALSTSHYNRSGLNSRIWLLCVLPLVIGKLVSC